MPSRPDPLENDFRPAGQIHAVVTPFDALTATRCDDVHYARATAVGRRGDG